MSDEPFVGKVYLEVGQGGSPQTYTRMCEITGMSGIGENNELIDVTTFCSGGNREFIGGLAEGTEITFDANFIVDSAQRRQMISDVKNKATRSFRIVVDDDNDSAADLTMWFNAAALSWNFQPSIEDKNMIQFGYKISGNIDITEP